MHTWSFQSTPVISDGRIMRQYELGVVGEVFQSTPVISDGRILLQAMVRRAAGRFNPRPSFLTGESGSAKR